MYVVGIVAEFDPFHTGHAYLINQARQKGADRIVAVMSGASVQRGEIASFPKHERAEMAVRSGADLVVELPSPFSCSCAEIFAQSAVHILVQLGVDAIAFGCENDNTLSLQKAAESIENSKNNSEIKLLMKSGINYPCALTKCIDEESAQIISKPNNMLAVQYIIALKRFSHNADIIPIKRIGAEHNGLSNGEFASASYIRKRLSEGMDVSKYLPYKTGIMAKKSVIENILLFNLITSGKEQLMRTPEIKEQLADKILIESKNPPSSYNELLMRIKSKNTTLAGIKRASLMLTLGVTKEDINFPPYLRILAFNQRGTQILKRSSTSLPVSHSLKKLEQSSEYAKRISELEMKAVRLYQLGTNDFTNEYTGIVKPINTEIS